MDSEVRRLKSYCDDLIAAQYSENDTPLPSMILPLTRDSVMAMLYDLHCSSSSSLTGDEYHQLQLQLIKAKQDQSLLNNHIQKFKKIKQVAREFLRARHLKIIEEETRLVFREEHPPLFGCGYCSQDFMSFEALESHRALAEVGIIMLCMQNTCF